MVVRHEDPKSGVSVIRMTVWRSRTKTRPQQPDASQGHATKGKNGHPGPDLLTTTDCYLFTQVNIVTAESPHGRLNSNWGGQAMNGNGRIARLRRTFGSW